MIDLVVKNGTQEGLVLCSVATRGLYPTVIQMRGPMFLSPHLALARHLCVGTTKCVGCGDDDGTTMRGTVGSSSVSLHIHTTYASRRGTILNEGGSLQTSCACWVTVSPIGGSSRAPIVFPPSRKTSVICQANHGSRRTVTVARRV